MISLDRFAKYHSLARMALCAFLFPAGFCSLAHAESKPAHLSVQPANLELRGAHADHAILVGAIMADGRSSDVTPLAHYTSKQPNIVTISTNGHCVARADGRAEIVVEHLGRKATISVTVTNAALVLPPSFRQDVEPLLTRAGCNMGACHGKLAGQNGFKLSLRGYAPELDYAWLTSDVFARRINPAFPDESLLVLKALAKVPHEGGQRFAEGSRYHVLLRDWISARAPGPVANEKDAVRLELLPGNSTMRVGETRQLLARAYYEDGRVRDITWLAQFFSNDENTASVTPDGVVKAVRHGETAIRAHFQGQVEILTITIPYENKIAPKDFVKTERDLDAVVFAKLKALRIPPSELCDDATFLRRASLDATGTLPTADKVRAFLSDRSKNKRSALVEQLLNSPEWVDYWTLQLADLLQNRKERDHDVRGTKGVRAFQAWLHEQVAANRPWNELTRDVLTASGDCVARPQVGYYITTVGEKSPAESEVVDSVAQSFLGTRVGCARCHNHPLEKFTQDDFYHFAAFFSRISLKREEPMKGATILSTTTKEQEQKKKDLDALEKKLSEAEAAVAKAEDVEKAKKQCAEQQKKLDEARKQYQQVMAKMPGVTQPRTRKFMAPQPLDRSVFDFKPGEDLRVELADWITSPKNETFSGAMVNRLWRHFFNVGLVEPVDDLRASNPPSNPQLWKLLNSEFVAHGYDFKHLMRLILNSRTYQLSSTTRAGNETDKRFYSHYYARRLPAEVMLDAISRATGVPDDFKSYPLGTRAIQLSEPGVASYFLTLFGRSDRVTACACERTGEVTLPQLLHLQNGDSVLKKISADDGRLSGLLKTKVEDDALIEELFLGSLGRYASKEEITTLKKSLSIAQKPSSPSVLPNAGKDVADTTSKAREEMLTDLFWALLNSKEFAFNH